jgi:CBS domain-containing protein
MADRLYRAPAAGALRIEPLGDLTAIFDRRSMQTHLVVAPMPEIIAAMGDTPCDAAMLAERLAAVDHEILRDHFDEIDRGVGGATADAVGRRLAGLADGGQVLVVTHSPQVAALGAHHWRVAKRVEDGMTLSTVTPLAEDERVDEIARMLSGDRITPEARAAALSLLG